MRRILTVITGSVFFAYAVYFSSAYGHMLNNEVLKNSLKAFWEMREPWIMAAFFAAIFYLIFVIISGNELISYVKKFEGKKALLFTAVAAFMIRLIPSMFVFGPDTDMGAFQTSQYLTGVEHNWKRAYEFMPYFYMQVYILHFAGKISAVLGIPAYFACKLPVIFFDSLNAALIMYLSGSREKGMLYAVSPIALLISAYHGMFDAVTVFFLLSLITVVIKNKNAYLSGLLAGLAFCSKIWVLIIFPKIVMTAKMKVIKMIPVFIAVFIVLSLPVLFDPAYYIKVLGYGSLDGWWGPGGLVKFVLTDMLKLNPVYVIMLAAHKILFAAGMIFVIFRTAKLDLIRHAAAVICAFYVLTPGWGIQYLLWIIPFLIITEENSKKLDVSMLMYCCVAYFMHLLFHTENLLNISTDNIRLLTAVVSIPAWFYFVILLRKLMQVK